MRGVLALDQGGHASRACVLDERGALVASAERAVATRYPAAQRVEHDADALAASLQQAAAAALEAAHGCDVRCAGLVTQRSTLVCWERGSGRALSPALSWQDRRHADWLAGFAGQAPRIRELTGLPLSPHYGAGKMRWCLDQLPQVQRAASRGELLAGPLAAFVLQRLTGAEALIDAANASRTLLFDTARLQWSTELLTLFSIPASVLPACTATQHCFGELRGGASAVTVQALSGDQSAVPFAAGAPDPGTLYLNLGTGAFLQCPLAARAAPGALLQSVLHSDGRQALYCLEGTVNGAGSAVSQFCAQHALSAEALWPALHQLPPQAPLPVFINTIGGLGSPYWRSDIEAHFLGSGTPLEHFAAVIESVLFLIAENLREFSRQGAAPRRVLVSGGWSRSDWLCTRLAAVLGLVVERGAAEASVRGIAALADPPLAAGWASPGTERFEPQRLPALAARYGQFQAHLQACIQRAAANSAST